MSAEQVRDYYDANTRAFEKFGQGGGHAVIRRAVWGPGVRSRADAFHYVDQLILQQVQEALRGSSAPLRVLDLGCGLGSSLLFLAARAPIEGVGITISGIQAARARERAQVLGLSSRVQCVHADFLALPDPIAPVQVALSIEAFMHSPTPHAYFEAAARLVLPGGVLIVCDDFLTARGRAALSRREARWIAELRHGWVAPSIVTAAEADLAAEQAGFQRTRTLDLTPYLELRRPRDRVLSAIVSVARHLPIPGYRWRSLLGGNALQMGLVSGLIEHRYTTWKRLA